MGMVDYIFAKEPELPDLPDCLYQYVVGRDGLYVRAERSGLRATIGCEGFIGEARGLTEVQTELEIVEKVPAIFLVNMLDFARQALPYEILFYLKYEPIDLMKSWQLVIPNQVQNPGSVHPVDPFNPNAQKALIEVHSHGRMDAFFSNLDNRDETGFRIYAVLGQIDDIPSIGVRVGIYGHFCPVRAETIFDLPDGLNDYLTLNKEKSFDYSTDPSDSFLDF